MYFCYVIYVPEKTSYSEIVYLKEAGLVGKIGLGLTTQNLLNLIISKINSD